MVWFLLFVVILCGFVALLRGWRQWIRPWSELQEIINEVGQGRAPRTFLVDGGILPRRVGVAIENIFLRQQQLDRQIKEQQASHETIFRAMADGLVVVDSKCRVLLLNEAARSMFNITAPVAAGEPMLDVLREPALDGLIEQTLQTNSSGAVDISLPHDGTAIRASAVPMSGKRGVVVLCHDVTQLKQVDQVRREFVANVSHELRTPLSILRGYIETLLQDTNIPEAELQRILRIMERHSNRLGLIANDLLTLAQLESDTPNLQLSTIKVIDVISGAAKDWESRFNEKALKVELDVSDGLSPIQADKGRLHEILYNLIDNAVKYSRAGDEIRLQARQHDGTIILSVSDTGPGISSEDLPRIFERFYRADKSRSREITGTGLGLSIVKHIAQLHGGAVEAESQLGFGTTIRVRLPIKSALTQARQIRNQSDTSVGPTTSHLAVTQT